MITTSIYIPLVITTKIGGLFQFVVAAIYCIALVLEHFDPAAVILVASQSCKRVSFGESGRARVIEKNEALLSNWHSLSCSTYTLQNMD
jgi:hypothetical protein